MSLGLAKTIITALVFPMVAGCSTYYENHASKTFEPIYDTIVPELHEGVPTGSIYNASASTGLFTTDQRARAVGDILTVSFTESFAATKSQSASASKSDSMSVSLPFDQSRLSAKLGLEGASEFSGSGSAAQSNSFTGLLSVSVIRIFANGNMEIMGQKMITLNNGNEYVRLRGVIRPEDISAGNAILSSQIADAKITYTGAGQVADTGQMGWLSRILRAVSPL